MAKKLEKLETEYQKVLETIRTSTQRKEELWREIREMRADTLLGMMEEQNISLEDATQSFALIQKVRESGMTVAEVMELLSSEASEPEKKTNPEETTQTSAMTQEEDDDALF